MNHVATMSMSANGATYSGAITTVGDGVNFRAIDLTALQANKAVSLAFDKDDVKSFAVFSPTLNIILEINDATTPDLVITVAAGGYFYWSPATGFANPFEQDTTAAFLTSSTNAAGTVYIIPLIDATP